MFNDYRVDVKYLIVISNENFMRRLPHSWEIYTVEYIVYMSGNMINNRL